MLFISSRETLNICLIFFLIIDGCAECQTSQQKQRISQGRGGGGVTADNHQIYKYNVITQSAGWPGQLSLLRFPVSSKSHLLQPEHSFPSCKCFKISYSVIIAIDEFFDLSQYLRFFPSLKPLKTVRGKI